MAAAATRRDARERALELLYEAESKSVDVADVVAALPLEQDPYALELAAGVTDHRVEIDDVLSRFAKGWDVARMAQMDRAVMRLGVFELATKPEIPTGAILSEAVELAGQYGSTDDTSKFVNGVLAAAAAEIRGGDRPWSPVDTVVVGAELVEDTAVETIVEGVRASGTTVVDSLDAAAGSTVLVVASSTADATTAVEAGRHAVVFRDAARLAGVFARMGIDGAAGTA